jgi:hypothetical protein
MTKREKEILQKRRRMKNINDLRIAIVNIIDFIFDLKIL